MLLVCLATASAGAQSTTANTSNASDSTIARARALVDAGAGAEARLLLDSLVDVLPVSTEALANALFWRGVLSESASDAERDWKRLTIESPYSRYVPDALLRLAELDLLRGQQASARQYLERLLKDHARSPARPQALVLMARTWLADRDVRSACSALDDVRPLVLAGTELRAQVDDLLPQCKALAAASTGAGKAPPVSSAVQPDKKAPPAANAAPPEKKTPPAADSARVVTRTPPAPPRDSSITRMTPPANARYSVQLAAYNRAEDAEALVRRLAPRGIDARVDGTVQPFRVRTGYFVARADAAAELARLKARGFDGFIAELAR